MAQEQIREHLFQMQDIQYREFHSGLSPNVEHIIGIRVPVLRDYAKALLREYPMDVLMAEIGDLYYEELLLQGMLIGLWKEKDFERVAAYIRAFVPKLQSWGVCDTFCAGLKITKKYPKEMWELIQPYFSSGREYELRFAVVMLLDFFVDEEHLQADFELLNGIQSEAYYVRMAAAWAWSVCLVKYYEETKAYLTGEECRLDHFTYQKALQKAIESYRLKPEQKEELRLNVRRLWKGRGY